MTSVTSPSGLDDPRIWVTVVTRCGGLPRTPPPTRAAPLPAPRRRRRCVKVRQTDGGPQKPAGRLSKLKTAFYPAQRVERARSAAPPFSFLDPTTDLTCDPILDFFWPF